MFCPRAPLETLAERKATSAPSSTDSAVSSRGRARAAITSLTQNSRERPTPLWVIKAHTAPAGRRTKAENTRFSR